MNKLYKVYEHWTPDNMVYVGVTCQDLKLRWYESQYRTTALKEHIDKWGWNNIKHKVIYTTPDRAEAYKVEDEMYWYYKEKGIVINKQRSGLVQAKDGKAYKQQWYQKYKDDPEFKKKRAAYMRKYKKDNPEYREKQKELTRKYNQNHKEQHNAYKRKYYKDHPEYREKQKDYLRQYRAKKKAS